MFKRINTLLLSAALVCLGGTVFQPGAQIMRNITTQELVKDMGLGVNLGNTFESESNNVNNIETAWGSPTITKEMIAVYPKTGFKTVRVPVRWTNAIGSNNTINPALMNRVEEVVGWILDEGMYVILNIHHEAWIRETMPNDSANVMARYLRIWEQVAERFKDYGDKLMFEGLNEEGHWNARLWTPPTGVETRPIKSVYTVFCLRSIKIS